MNTLLRRFGIDPVRFRLLTWLFGQLSARRELMSEFGRSGIALKTAAWMYFVMTGLVALVFVAVRPPLASYFVIFLGMTALVLFTILVSETSNSLVNPVEGLVLAHQPIDGATYTAAKLAHLLRIILYLVPGVNAVPCLAGLLLKGAPWWYPFAHMACALVLGVVIGLLCCALFGWLIRFVPAPRLKSVSQAAELLSVLAVWLPSFGKDILLRVSHLPWPTSPLVLRSAAAAAVLLAIAAVIFGLRSLSGDYLVRVASIMSGGASKRTKRAPVRVTRSLATRFGGQVSRAAYEYVRRMMLRDWQYRRQLISFAPMVVILCASAARQLRINPFSGRFTAVHLLPHAFGAALLIVCVAMPYGTDHKGVWLFLLAPGRVFQRFARGVWAFLWIHFIVIPHAILLAVLAWLWGLPDAVLFVVYSAATASAWLSLELRLIDGIPFGQQARVRTQQMMLPIMLISAAAMGALVALQYFVVFRSMLLVVALTLIISAAACFLTRRAFDTMETAMRYNLGLLTTESAMLYHEIDA